MNRFFRTSPEVYEPTRLGLDAAFGNPGPYAETCLPPVAEAPKDEQGRVYLAVLDTMFEWPVVQENVATLIQQGFVDELLPEDYWDAISPPPTIP